MWITIFLPLVGCIIYIFSEMRSGRNIRTPKIDISAAINPAGKIKKQEETLRFSDTFDNKMKLADAYLAGGQTEQAVELYEKSLIGTFAENEYGLAQLATAYFEQEHYDDVISTLKGFIKLSVLQAQELTFYMPKLWNEQVMQNRQKRNLN